MAYTLEIESSVSHRSYHDNVYIPLFSDCFMWGEYPADSSPDLSEALHNLEGDDVSPNSGISSVYAGLELGVRADNSLASEITRKVNSSLRQQKMHSGKRSGTRRTPGYSSQPVQKFSIESAPGQDSERGGALCSRYVQYEAAGLLGKMSACEACEGKKFVKTCSFKQYAS